MTIYTTNEYKGYSKHEYYHYEYRVEGDEVTKYKCYRRKFFDGKENEWEEEERIDQSWALDDPSIPEWLKQYL